jgi:hypothetical protein
MVTLTLKTKAWLEGYAAGRRGFSENPYPVGSVKASAWKAGLFEGLSRRLAVVNNS